MENKNKKLVCGVGINDLTKNRNCIVYEIWYAMLRRCYSNKCLEKKPTYKGCSVCDEWLIFSKFKEWADQNNKIDQQLDKDILVRGNKIYGPQLCRFVPREINNLLLDHGAKRGKYLQGVSFNKSNQKFKASISRGNGAEHIGYYDTELEAFNAYKVEKELWIKHQADKYFSLGQIDSDIHKALQNWVI